MIFFASEAYWEARYRTAVTLSDEENYEWFDADFSTLQPLLDRYIQRNDTVLEIGCGTSRLLPGLRDNNHTGMLIGTDFSETVCKYMQEKHKGMCFKKMDARDMQSIKSDSVDVLLDKGCLNKSCPLLKKAKNQRFKFAVKFLVSYV